MEPDLNKLREYLSEESISQEFIAKRLGVTKAYINHLLSGRSRFGKQSAQKWSECFGISSSWLLTGEGEMLTEAKKKARPAMPDMQYDQEYVQRLLDEIERLKEENISLRAENNVLRELNGLPKRGVA